MLDDALVETARIARLLELSAVLRVQPGEASHEFTGSVDRLRFWLHAVCGQRSSGTDESRLALAGASSFLRRPAAEWRVMTLLELEVRVRLLYQGVNDSLARPGSSAIALKRMLK